jgi:hypothetical protein
MPFVTGIKHLVKVGFTCDDRGSAPAITCTRMRQSILPYTCIQRVDLKTDSDRKTIVEVRADCVRQSLTVKKWLGRVGRGLAVVVLLLSAVTYVRHALETYRPHSAPVCS